MENLLNNPLFIVMISVIGTISCLIATIYLFLIIRKGYERKATNLLRFQWVLMLVMGCSGMFSFLEAFPCLGPGVLRGLKIAMRIGLASSIIFYWRFSSRFYEDDGQK